MSPPTFIPKIISLCSGRSCEEKKTPELTAFDVKIINFGRLPWQRLLITKKRVITFNHLCVSYTQT